MVAWSDVCAWRPDPLAEAGDGLRSLQVSLRGLADDARVAGSRVVSLGAGVEAARAALHRCTASHEELVEEVGVLARATAEACEGVVEVRRRVLECQDFAEARPYLALGGDGSVSLDALAAGGGLGAAAAVGSGGLGVAEVARAQEDAAELEAMVARTLALATEVDQDYATALAAAGGDPNRDVDSSRAGRQWTDPREAEDSRRNSGGGHGDPGTQGSDELGEPVPGEEADMPGVDPWVYPGDTEDEGSGVYGSRPAGPWDLLIHESATVSARAMASRWPDASRNLQHFLGNSGDPLELDADRMLEDVDGLSIDTQAAADRMVGKALADARASGVEGPVTYPFTTKWEDYYIYPEEDQNWFYATGGCNYATEGTVTVYPPTQDNPEWTYSYDYRVHVADRYNWDGEKSTQIGPVEVSDEMLQELHQAGIAQEYDMSGESSVVSGDGP
ncbi:hypothetical protein [Actinomyces wuliandei]|uniref:hypothetical protein n=1 Tax=Actinomyces wuliandei TaxID=2057743 RepID=UPI000FDCA4CF|nr:hypothetical protein [Actinomyces wuliandei]